MGDPSKVILLEEMVKVIDEWRLLENAATIGDRIVNGLTQLQVSSLILLNLLWLSGRSVLLLTFLSFFFIFFSHPLFSYVPCPIAIIALANLQHQIS